VVTVATTAARQSRLLDDQPHLLGRQSPARRRHFSGLATLRSGSISACRRRKDTSAESSSAARSRRILRPTGPGIPSRLKAQTAGSISTSARPVCDRDLNVRRSARLGLSDISPISVTIRALSGLLRRLVYATIAGLNGRRGWFSLAGRAGSSAMGNRGRRCCRRHRIRDAETQSAPLPAPENPLPAVLPIGCGPYASYTREIAVIVYFPGGGPPLRAAARSEVTMHGLQIGGFSMCDSIDRAKTSLFAAGLSTRSSPNGSSAMGGADLQRPTTIRWKRS